MLIAASVIGQLEKDLKDAREALRYAESQEQAGNRVLSQKHRECDELKAINEQQKREIERLTIQLAASEQRNKEISGSISATLTRRPEGIDNCSPKEDVKELVELHELSRRSMKSAFKALWPNETIPEGMAELADRLKGARRRLQSWKESACREGAREAWAMIKTRYTELDTEHLAEVGPLGTDGEEIPTSLVYDDVMPAARLSQQDCCLDSLIDGIE